MEKRLSINTFNAITAIIGAVMTGTMLFWMFSTVTVGLYYFYGIVMIGTNIVGLTQQKNNGGKICGNVLAIIASGLHAVTGLLAVPAMVLYIIASVFLFKNKISD